MRFDRPFSPAQLEAWRYDSGKTGRGLKHLDEKGRLTRILALQGVYRVTPKTAEVIAAVVSAAAPALPAPNEATALEARLRDTPADEATARVPADAWQTMCNGLLNLGSKWLVQPMFIAPKSPKTSPYGCTTANDPASNRIVDETGAVFTADLTETVPTLE